jgi:hypothetical protein
LAVHFGGGDGGGCGGGVGVVEMGEMVFLSPSGLKGQLELDP